MTRGIFIGRFQPFHLGHLEILKKILKEKDEAIIIIGSSEQSYTQENPFTAGERVEMILKTAEEIGERERVIIIPARDINRFDLWVDHIVSLSPRFDSVYTNSSITEMLFSLRGFKVVNTSPFNREDYSGVRIRALMAEEEEHWETLVPKAVLDFLKEINGQERVRTIYKGY